MSINLPVGGSVGVEFPAKQNKWGLRYNDIIIYDRISFILCQLISKILTITATTRLTTRLLAYVGNARVFCTLRQVFLYTFTPTFLVSAIYVLNKIRVIEI